jgi:hypothetical protein
MDRRLILAFLNLMPRAACGVDKFWNNGYGRFGASKQF